MMKEKTDPGRPQDGAREDSRESESRVIHRINLEDWYCTQYGRTVAVYQRGSPEPKAMLEPPLNWGLDWA